MLRAVIEGICYHLRWMLECEDKKVKTSDTIRFVGGGSLSEVTSQILADITGRKIETVEQAKDVGAMGAALLVAVGSGCVNCIGDAGRMVKVKAVYTPNPDNKEVYERGYRVFKRLYKNNKKNYQILNAKTGGSK